MPHQAPGSAASTSPILLIKKTDALSRTRQAGENMREEWLGNIARRSRARKWSNESAEIAIYSDVLHAVIAGRLKSRKSADQAIGEGKLAAHPGVRNHFERLVRLRDELWETERDFLADPLYGPYQML